MILPNVRASFGRAEASYVIWLLTRGSESAREKEEARLREEGFDAILDDPRTLNALLAQQRGFSTAPQELVFYVVVRHALLERGISDRTLADYISAIVINPPVQYAYLTDLVKAAESSSGEHAFRLHARLGDFALWLSGMFPDYITARVQRKGAPPIRYYERLGANGYRNAADFTTATTSGMKQVYRDAAESFTDLRVALNAISDRYLFPARAPSIERMLRQISDA